MGPPMQKTALSLDGRIMGVTYGLLGVIRLTPHPLPLTFCGEDV
jgi:hypothetical protein